MKIPSLEPSASLYYIPENALLLVIVLIYIFKYMFSVTLIALCLNCNGNWLTTSISFFSTPITSPFIPLVKRKEVRNCQNK